MTYTSTLECQDCGAELENDLAGYCDLCRDALNQNRRAPAPRRLAKKPQDFDTSALPLFGDTQRQQELF